MAQSNTFRTKRRRANNRRNRENADNRASFEAFVKQRRPLHEGINSFMKRIVESTRG